MPRLRRTEADLEGLLPLHPRIRLVKGAYAEPPDRAFQGRRAVDESYLKLAALLLSWVGADRAETVFATHDTGLLAQIADLARALGAGPHGHEVHMLFGIRSDEARRLAADGVRVRILISYGPDWAAWYMRRLAERPANVLLAASALLQRQPPAAISVPAARGG